MAVTNTSIEKARVRVHLEGKATFADDIAFFGRTVGPRTGSNKRTHGQMEDFCMRRWLVAMLVRDLLRFPVVVEALPPHVASQRKLPDFTVRWDDGERLGVEVTQAGPASWQAWLTRSESVEEDVILYPGDGYAGDAPERTVVTDIVSAISRKAEKSKEGAYSGAGRCDLLIYENSEGGVLADQGKVIRLLLDESKRALQSGLRTFARFHLVFGDIVYLDLFSEDRTDVLVSKAHAEDWAGWLSGQAKHVRERSMPEIDFDNLAEELESLGRSDQRALASQMRRLLVHLLKWQFQSSRRSKTWVASIQSTRNEIETILEESPSLTNRLRELLSAQYSRARRDSAKEMGTDIHRLPEACAYLVDELLDHEFLPKA